MAFIINAPSALALGWRAIKPVLNENTQAKISINAGDCREELTELFGGDVSKVASAHAKIPLLVWCIALF